MKKTICACLFLSVFTAHSCANAQENEKLTISTYYPAPNAVYQTMRLKPLADTPGDAKPGQLYYNSTDDQIMYYNRSGSWAGLTGAGSDGAWHFTPNDTFPGGTPRPGSVFYNNTTNSIVFYNRTRWVNVSVRGPWAESDYKPGSPGHFDIYPANLTASLQRMMVVGYPYSDKFFDVFLEESAPGSNEQEKLATFSKYFTDHGTSQELFISAFPEGAYKTYLDASSLITVPDGHLKFAVYDKNRTITMHVGGYYSPDSEVMTVRNPAGEAYPANYSVSIGTSSGPFPFTIDSNDTGPDYDLWMPNSPFAVRGVHKGRKTGVFNVYPHWEYEGLGYGYTIQEAGAVPDPYIMSNGMANHFYVQLAQAFDGTGEWFAGDMITPSGYPYISYGSGPGDTDWNLAREHVLWWKTGVLNISSSRGIKENFIPVDPEKMLRKIDRLEVNRWNFKSQDKTRMHIGPVAEDFYQIFKTGNSEKNLFPVDSLGVSLVGLKALISKSNAQQMEIEELKSRVAVIKSKLNQSR